MDASRPPFLALLPLAPVAVPLFNIGWLRQKLWPIGQQAMGVAERRMMLDWQQWHTYQIMWGVEKTLFRSTGLKCFRPRRHAAP